MNVSCAPFVFIALALLALLARSAAALRTVAKSGARMKSGCAARNPNVEYRNSKQIQNSNDRMTGGVLGGNPFSLLLRVSVVLDSPRSCGPTRTIGKDCQSPMHIAADMLLRRRKDEGCVKDGREEARGENKTGCYPRGDEKSGAGSRESPGLFPFLVAIVDITLRVMNSSRGA